MLEATALGAVFFGAVVIASSALGRAWALAGGAVIAAAVIAFAATRPVTRAPSGPVGPSTALDYVSSSACRACHPGEHASFSRTYHRTMTQRASTATVKAALGEGSPLASRGDAVWAGDQRVVMTTGSHRQQAYWTRESGELRLLPFVWLVEERAFVARRDAFLQPPDAPSPSIHWASNCIACHVVAGEPRHDLASDAFVPRAVELGIACEACHGPGRAHVERHRDPVERFLQRASKKADPTIIHPKRLSPERSAALCGQCHAYAFPRDEDTWWTEGYSRTFRAGDALERSRMLLDPITLAKPGAPTIDFDVSALFWPDGTVRVGGREYAGLVKSACFERGAGDRKLTCLSCHAMHEGDPAGQIAPARRDDAMCTSCHAKNDHSHHRAVACVDCHMPKTSYALLRAVRSHRIESPRVRLDKPNACNLCHLGETLAWTARSLEAWYGRASPAIPEPRRSIAAGIYDGLAGDAALRALVADASRDGAVLDALKDDPYAVVRFIARRSLSRIPSAPTKTLDPGLRRALVEARDDRPVTLAE